MNLMMVEEWVVGCQIRRQIPQDEITIKKNGCSHPSSRERTGSVKFITYCRRVHKYNGASLRHKHFFVVYIQFRYWKGSGISPLHDIPEDTSPPVLGQPSDVINAWTAAGYVSSAVNVWRGELSTMTTEDAPEDPPEVGAYVSVGAWVVPSAVGA